VVNQEAANTAQWKKSALLILEYVVWIPQPDEGFCFLIHPCSTSFYTPSNYFGWDCTVW